MKLTIVLAVALLAACAGPGTAPPREESLGDCLFRRGATGVFEGVGGVHYDWYAVQACQSEIDQRRRAKERKQ